MKEYVHRFDTLVCGCGINTLLYCYKRELPLLINDCRNIFHFETIEGDFSFMGFSKTEVLTAELWNRLYFLMSMSGLIFNPLPSQNIRFDNNNITYITQGNRKVMASYNKLNNFERKQNIFDVYDWFAVRDSSRHNHERLHDKNNDLVNVVKFHKSLRANATRAKDIVTVSKILEEQIDEFEYSETMARLKTLKMLKEAGIKGKYNGTNKKGYKLYYSIKLEHMYRESIPRVRYKMSLDNILKIKQNEGKLWNLTKNLFIRKTHSI